MKCLAVACGLGLFLSSCATMFTNAKTRFVARSDDPQAKIYLNNRYLGKGSATAKARRYGTDIIVGKKAGCSDATRQLDKKTYWGWFLVGNCLLNYCIGLLVDLATGAHRGLDQQHYIVTPNCS